MTLPVYFARPRIKLPARSTHPAPVRAAFRLARTVLSLRRLLEAQGQHRYAIFMLWEPKIAPAIVQSREFTELVAAFARSSRASSHLGTLVGFGDHGVNSDASGHIMDFLRGLIRPDESLPFDEPELWAAAERFWRTYLEPDLVFEVGMPCWGIDLPVDAVDLGHGCTLAKVTRPLERELRASQVHSVDWTSDPPTTFLSWKTRTPKTFGESAWGAATKENAGRSSRATTALQAAIEGMYAFKEGWFERGRWLTIRQGPRGGHSHERGSNWGLRDPFRRPTYVLSDAAEAEALAGFLAAARNRAPEHVDLTRVPLRRFFLANERDHVDDAFIDLLIAVEALVSTDAEKSEINYRVGQRMALLVGETLEERLQLVQVMKAAYDVRSTLVHGREYTKPVKVGSERKTLRTFLSEVREVVRKAIHKTILLTAARGPGADPFEWDKRILGA